MQNKKQSTKDLHRGTSMRVYC